MSESSVRLIGDVADRVGCRGLSRHSATLFTDKLAMLAQAGDIGVDAPRTWRASSQEWWDQKDVEAWVLKPRLGTTAVGVTRCDSRDELKHRIASLTNPDSHIVQEYVAGRMYYANAVVVDGRTSMFYVGTYVEPVMDTGKRPRTFLQMWMVDLSERCPPGIFDELRRRHDLLREGFGLQTGWTHMEFFQDKGGRLLFCEAAARPAGVRIRNMERHFFGVTSLEAFAAALVDDWPPSDRPRHGAVGQIDFTAEGPVRHYSSLGALSQDWILESSEWPVAEVAGGDYTSPLARVVLCGRDTAECETRLKELSEWFGYVPA
jgi:biotin carboxylase